MVDGFADIQRLRQDAVPRGAIGRACTSFTVVSSIAIGEVFCAV
jgi:hypothetical protein